MAVLDSSTNGYLLPQNIIIDDQDLDRLLHDMFVNISALPNEMVRPRWLIEPSNMPDIGVLWMAQGIVERRPDVIPSQIMTDTGYVVTRYETFDVLISCYSEKAGALAGVIRDSLSLDQNRDYIRSQGIVLVEIGTIRNTSTVVNGRWLKRVDLTITFRRTLTRHFNVLDIKQGVGVENTDIGYNPSIQSNIVNR